MFIIGTGVIFVTQNYYYKEYVEIRSELVKKEKLAIKLHNTYYQVLSDYRGYFAYGNKDLKNNATTLQQELKVIAAELEEMESSDEDRHYNRELVEFNDYYFSEAIPKSIQLYESGQREALSQFTIGESTPRVRSFLELSTKYNESIINQLDVIVSEFTSKQRYMQVGLVVFFLFTLFVLLQIIKMMSRKIGQPLGRLTFAAEQISKGHVAEIEKMPERHDELGALALAFNKMVRSVHDNEQNLLAKNEELIAQQDELYSQQISLEEALETMALNEEKLRMRNELINGISNSLDKQKVLDSIVVGMSRLIEADRGIITLLEDDCYGAYGVSEQGIQQFLAHINNGFLERLSETKEPFIVKKEMDVEDKGIHETKGYCYDLYLPILSTTDEIMAIIVLTRFGGPFSESNHDDYRVLGKQIGLSLEKIKLYEETEHNRHLNQNILNTIQEAIQLVDADGIIVQINDKFSKMMPQYQERELISLPFEKWIDMMKNEVCDKQAFECFFKKAVSQDNVNEKEEFIYQKQDGQVYKVYCESQFQDKEKVGTVIVHRDITKEYEVDRIKSEFVSTVSHELRTPLASILGFTELLLNRQLKEERQKKYLTTIYNEGKRLTSLINDFLDVQRMEAGKQTYEKKYVDLLPIVEKVISNQRIQTAEHEIICKCLVKNTSILGDKLKLEQVFTNLINNGIKYSPKGGRINVKIYEDDGHVKVDIQDEGLGIPEEAVEKLFTKFYRVDNSDRRSIGGTGLGLSIVQEIMKAHDGEVSVQSNYGKGSTFTVSFPSINANRLETIDDNEGMYKVLVVEDDQSLADLICQELNESGFEIIHLSSGKAVIQYLEEEIPDAIVLDIMLEEGIDGWTILKHLKEKEALKHVPVIVSTALDEKEKGLALGADDYFVKPYKPSQLSKATMQTILKMGKIGQILVPEKEL